MISAEFMVFVAGVLLFGSVMMTTVLAEEPRNVLSQEVSIETP